MIMRQTLTRILLCIPLLAAACALPRQPGPAVPLHVPERQGLPDTAPKRFLILIFVILAVASLGACALFRVDGSWAEDLSEREAASAGEILAALIADRIPPGGRAILLIKPSSPSLKDALNAQLASLLEARGYAIADSEKPGDAHRLRYLITAFEGSFVLRVTIDGGEVSTVLKRAEDGILIATAPLSVREDRR
jgi:hypothetical protein